MPTRAVLSLAMAVGLVVGGALWLLLPERTDAARSDEAPARLPAADSRAGADGNAADATSVGADTRVGDGTRGSPSRLVHAPVEVLRSEDCSVADHVNELIEDLTVLHWSSLQHDTRRLEARRLERFVLDAVSCDRTEETRAALHARRAAAGADADRAWLQSPLLIALLGLGADVDLPRLWKGLPPPERPGVLLALAWDPLRSGHGQPLDCAQLEGFLYGEPLLPLSLGRAPDDALRGWVTERLRDDDGVRDAACIVLGLSSEDWPEARDTLVQTVLAHPRQARVPLFMLLRDPGEAARQAIEMLRRRHGGFRGIAADDLEGHEHFALELAQATAAARAELPDAAALAAALRDAANPAARLDATSLALARLVDGGLSPDALAQLSDGLCAALAEPSDPDSDWLGLLALVRLHVRDRYQPQLSIGYDSDEPVDRARSDERTSIFLRHLADEQPSQRRLAVMGLFGTAEGDDVRQALAAALVTEDDRGVASWIRLALIRL